MSSLYPEREHSRTDRIMGFLLAIPVIGIPLAVLLFTAITKQHVPF
jgi:hypothetical protein